MANVIDAPHVDCNWLVVSKYGTVISHHQPLPCSTLHHIPHTAYRITAILPPEQGNGSAAASSTPLGTWNLYQSRINYRKSHSSNPSRRRIKKAKLYIARRSDFPWTALPCCVFNVPEATRGPCAGHFLKRRCNVSGGYVDKLDKPHQPANQDSKLARGPVSSPARIQRRAER